jgi:hypothetical protein
VFHAYVSLSFVLPAVQLRCSLCGETTGTTHQHATPFHCPVPDALTCCVRVPTIESSKQYLTSHNCTNTSNEPFPSCMRCINSITHKPRSIVFGARRRLRVRQVSQRSPEAQHPHGDAARGLQLRDCTKGGQGSRESNFRIEPFSSRSNSLFTHK